MVNDPKWRMVVDRSACIRSGKCVSLAPKHFSFESAGARPINTLVEPGTVVIDAAESCPVEAIRVFSALSGEQIAPSSLD
ncbi:ferredoxin [Mycobacteroides sp. LB1]|nr:ferredoxin [Mycobacteroides sp. LB1]